VRTASDEQEKWVLVLMPTGRDAELVCTTLDRAGIRAHPCQSAEELSERVTAGCGAVLLAEEAVEDESGSRFIQSLDNQPIWSDLPVILFSSHSRNAEKLLRTLGSRVNITIVERPIRITMLISAVRGALRARQRQYQTRDLLDQLEQADHQKDLFLATLSHELRTPLNSILGWIQILRGRKVDAEATKHALEVIERNAHSQSEMISDILFVSRIITGKLEIKHEPLDVSEVVHSVVEAMRPAASAKSIELTVETEDYDPAPVEGDAERLGQVFSNLLTNATKFTPEGGKIVVRLKRSGSNVSVSVEDNGQGINPTFLPYVFERFRQADSTYTRRIGGLGLGLAIVRHLVELHGGQVTAQSQGKDRGSVFTITLPVADTKRFRPANLSSKDKGSPFPPAGKKLSGLTALLVEDDQDSREMLTLALRMCDVRVVSVETAADALVKLREVKPDFLISDIGLPGQDGYDLIRKLRSLPAADGGDTPAVALTGYVSVQDRNQALSAGYQDHLPKPVDTNKLIELLAELVAKPGARMNGKSTSP
jgi:signal transduction histidine kinase/CheY-like chemotaxis protein